MYCPYHNISVLRALLVLKKRLLYEWCHYLCPRSIVLHYLSRWAPYGPCTPLPRLGAAREPSLARMARHAGVRTARPGSTPTGANFRVSHPVALFIRNSVCGTIH
jgi:hypothetical protein